jgi:hypothetical protein
VAAACNRANSEESIMPTHPTILGLIDKAITEADKTQDIMMLIRQIEAKLDEWRLRVRHPYMHHRRRR